MHNYHSVHGTFPPAYLVDGNGAPMHSWRVLLLPFLEEQALYRRYRFDEPWDGPNNRKLHQTIVPCYSCAGDGTRKHSAATSYVAVVGPGTAWPGKQPTKLSDFTDGTSNSILIVEVADSGIHWMEPRDLDSRKMDLVIGAKSGRGISSKHASGANVVLADGSVHHLSPELDPRTLRALLSINGGEAPSLEVD